MSSPSIRVECIGSRSLECTSNTVEIDTGESSTTGTTNDPASTTSATSAGPPSPPNLRQDEIVKKFSKVLLDRLKSYQRSSSEQRNDKPAKIKSTRVEVDTASKKAHTIALQAIILDNPTNLPMEAMRVNGRSQKQLLRQIESAIDEAGHKVEKILNIWKNVGEKNKTETAEQSVITIPDATLASVDMPEEADISVDNVNDKGKGKDTDEGKAKVEASSVPVATQEAKDADIQPDRRSTKRKANDARQSLNNKRARADINAQETVPKWYGNRCALTNKEIVDAGHIFAVGLRNQDLERFWTALYKFWPWEDIDAWEEELAQPQVEVRNIIPLGMEAHRRWDDHYFALRPIKHMSDKKIMYVQLCWVNPIDLETGKRQDKYPRDYIDIQGQHNTGGLCDGRDITNNGEDNAAYVRSIRSGDVFRFTTSDPEKFPLPSYDLLSLQWALHRVLGAVKATGSLETIFSDPAPPDAPSLASRSNVLLEDSLLAYLADVAEDRRVLTPDMAAKWRGAVAKAKYEKLQADAENLAYYAENRGRESLFWLPPLPSFDEFLQESMIDGAVQEDSEEEDGEEAHDDGHEE
ncbi:hypothetical protein CONLIGDRAFT_702655 [Coniochaeta ligniaria NRRL 30616]|uniref:HNH nuclease domain-containing protein n=1 Tax=Coniochaeta ligniaria NRRL 30616 TaxID=1408157 RepID=A0A1J7JQV9_9PEZI|nr:hypothetical protein CONLIGDRAFT_702655 [Coniochaeta ligniaria NRRL 30616]